MGFVALPLWGLHASLRISTAVCLAGGCAAWLLLDRPRQRWPRLGMAALACGLWVVIPWLVTTRLPADFLADPSQLVDFREGAAANVAVVQKQDSRRLEIDRWWQGEEGRSHQIMAAHLPMLMRPQAKRVLVVGGGLGQTASRFLMYDVGQLDCVEIEPAVFDLVLEHFDARWMDNSQVKLLIEDGRNYISHSDAAYDVISLELGQVFRPGVASFYTEDFYRRARARLAADGLICQFVPVPFFRPHEFRSVLRTFQEVFPVCYLWYNTSELLLVGSREPIRVDAAQITAAWSSDAVQRDLRFSHWGGPQQWVQRRPVLVSCFLAGPAEIEELARGGEIYRDDRPVLEFSAAAVRATEVNEIPVSELLSRHLADVSSVFDGPMSRAELAEIQELRRQHLGDMVATGLMRRIESLESAGNYPEIVAVLKQALTWNGASVRANRLLGESLLQLGRPADARPYLEQAVAVDANHSLAHRALGVALHRLGEPAEAMDHYRKAAASRPDDPELLNNLGVALAQSGQVSEAVAHFRQAVALRPGYADAQRNLAQALRVQSASAAPQPSRAP
jgi:spermidine synthase